MKNNFYILTGGPGSGKTTVLNEIARRNICTVGEVARKIIISQKKCEGVTTHDGDKALFNVSSI